MSETTNKKPMDIKVGYYSMGISTILAGILLVINQMGYVVAEGMYILWPIMLVLLGLETIITKFVSSVGKTKTSLSPAWGILIICVSLVACSQVWIMLLNSTHIIW